MSKKLETESTLHDPQQDESILGTTQADASKLHNPQQDDLLYGTIPMDTSSDRYISEDDGTQEQSGSGQLLQGGQCLGRPKIPKLDFSKIKKCEEGQENLSIAHELGSDDGNLSSEEDDKAIVSGHEEKVTDELKKDPRPDPERPECVPELNLSFVRGET